MNTLYDMTAPDSIFVVIPAYNESRVIRQVVKDVHAQGYPTVIVVDDGSTDTTHDEAGAAGAYCIQHKVNRGKGAAAKTGLEASKVLGANISVIMDGDGQHDPRDIDAVVQPLVTGEYDVVLGTRALHHSAMPWHKVVGNRLANGVTWTYSGLWVHDSQSGFRAFSARALEYIDTQANAYEYESEIIKEIARHKLRFKEVPITVRYTEYSVGKAHKQGIVNGAKTAYKMLLHRLL